MGVKTDAENAVRNMRRISFNRVTGGRWGTSHGCTVLRHDEGTLYVIHQETGRLFRSVTLGSNKITGTGFGQGEVIHEPWIQELATHGVPGGGALMQRYLRHLVDDDESTQEETAMSNTTDRPGATLRLGTRPPAEVKRPIVTPIVKTQSTRKVRVEVTEGCTITEDQFRAMLAPYVKIPDDAVLEIIPEGSSLKLNWVFEETRNE